MMMIGIDQSCGYCNSLLWFNDKGDFYCSNCRIYNDTEFDIAVCINCGGRIKEEDPPITLFSSPPKTFCPDCFQLLIKNGVIKIG